MSAERRDRFRRRCMEPVWEERVDWCGGTVGVWIVAQIRESGVGVAFLESGYDGRDLHWGLVFLADRGLGDSGAWYRDLAELVEDCGWC